MPNEIGPSFADATMLRPAPVALGPSPWAQSNVLAHRKDGPGHLGANSVRICILGEPASKGNSRRIVKLGQRLKSIKSEKALRYAKTAAPQILVQCRRAGWRCHAVGPVRVSITIYYASERPDLDESVILDALQMIAYANDRQVREKHVYHAIDKENPRAEIVVEVLP